MNADTSRYAAAQLTIDYPDRSLERLSTFFRLFWMIPILIVLSLLSGQSMDSSSTTSGGSSSGASSGLGWSGLVFAPLVLMILFRQKYPRWWFDWNVELSRFSTRVAAYLALMDDRYPSTDEAQSVHLEYRYPDAQKDLNRWLPLVKWLLAIPHYFVLAFLGLGAVGAVVIAWFAIVTTGRYPRALFDYVQGVIRWTVRVGAYAFVLVTDDYPPFSLRP